MTAFGVSLIKDRWPKKIHLLNHFKRSEHVVQFAATTTECFDCTTTSKFHFRRIDCFNKASWKKKSSNVALKLDDWYGIVRMEAAWNTFTTNCYSFHLHVRLHLWKLSVGMFDFFDSEEWTKVRTNRQRLEQWCYYYHHIARSKSMALVN